MSKVLQCELADICVRLSQFRIFVYINAVLVLTTDYLRVYNLLFELVFVVLFIELRDFNIKPGF